MCAHKCSRNYSYMRISVRSLGNNNNVTASRGHATQGKFSCSICIHCSCSIHVTGWKWLCKMWILQLFQQPLCNISLRSKLAIKLRVKYSAFRFLLWKFDKNITTRVEIWIFPIHLHIGRDWGFSSKIGIIPTESRWLDLL